MSFIRYEALRHSQFFITVPLQQSSHESAVCTFTSRDNRLSQADFAGDRSEHADHNVACLVAQRGIQQLLSGRLLTKTHKPTRNFRVLSPGRSEVPSEKNLCRTIHSIFGMLGGIRRL